MVGYWKIRKDTEEDERHLAGDCYCELQLEAPAEEIELHLVWNR